MATAKSCIYKLVSENIQGRELVLVGNFLGMEKFLSEKGYKCAFHVSMENKGTEKSITEMKNKQDKYYIVFLSPINGLIDALMTEFGYVRVKDYCGLQEMERTIDNTSNYYDSFGNKCDFVPQNVFITFEGVNAEIKIDKSVQVLGRIDIHIKSNAKISIQKNSTISGTIVVWEKSEVDIGENTVCKFKYAHVCGKLKIGNFTTFGENTEVVVAEEKIIIGEDCMFSKDCVLYCGNGHSIYDVKSGERISNMQSIELKDHIWICQRSMLLSPLYVDSGSIIGAGSIARGCYPNNCLIAGVPSKQKKKDIFWSREMRKNIREEEMKYWRLTNENNSNNTD